MGQRDWRKLLQFRCTGCGNCCRETVVMVSDADVRRIMEGTGKPPREFLRFISGDDVSLDQRSPWWVRFASRRAVMALRWQRHERCIFLQPDERCGAYEYRPVTCREHPLNVTLSATGALLLLSRSTVVPCPHAWDGHQTPRALIQLRRWNDRQSDAYTDKVKEWNRCRTGRRTPHEFLRFLGLVPSAAAVSDAGPA